MQGKKQYQEKLFISFQLSNYVPEDNIYRKLDELLDLNFLYKATSVYYGNEGQKSIDPVVFMKLMLVGYLENLNSDRRIVGISRMRMDILYFLGYDLDEEFPWHSTLSRTRRLYGQEVFTGLFKEVLRQCVERGMLSGRRQALDGVFLKANASMDSLTEQEILKEIDNYSNDLSSNEGDSCSIRPAKKIHNMDCNGIKPKKNPGNKTHYSPSDPDARISVKSGKVPAMNYLGQVGVDTGSHIITHVQVFKADKRDSQCLPQMLESMSRNMKENGLSLQELIADRGYSSGEALRTLEESGVKGYIPDNPHFRYGREGFAFHPEGNYYTCRNGKKLEYKGLFLAGRYWNHEYRRNKSECAGCTFTGQCSAAYHKGARIRETIDKPYYDRMHTRMQSKKSKWLMKKRHSTVEPVIGTLVNYLGMKRINCKGIEQANKCLTVAALVYNLKKLLNHRTTLGRNWIQRQCSCPKKQEVSNYFLYFGVFF